MGGQRTNGHPDPEALRASLAPAVLAKLRKKMLRGECLNPRQWRVLDELSRRADPALYRQLEATYDRALAEAPPASAPQGLVDIEPTLRRFAELLNYDPGRDGPPCPTRPGL
jgi:hypothetical protein